MSSRCTLIFPLFISMLAGAWLIAGLCAPASARADAGLTPAEARKIAARFVPQSQELRA